MAFPDDPCETCIRVLNNVSLPCIAQIGKSKYLCRKLNKSDPIFNKDMYELFSLEDSRKYAKIYNKIDTTLVNEISKNNNISNTNTKKTNAFKYNKIINSCKDRSIKKTIKNAQGVSQIIHVITLDDGSELTYSDCGCGMNRCRIGKGNREGYVNFQDCLACVKERGLLPDEPPEKQPGLGDGWESKKEIS